MTRLIMEMNAREIRAERIAIRRSQNKSARSRGFRNFDEMYGGRDDNEEREYVNRYYRHRSVRYDG